MKPIRKDKPSPTVFIIMTVVYFGSYFGLKYGVFGGAMPWVYNLLLIGVCLAVAFFLRGKLGS